jgi:predicted lipoprotein with Yx(FWY)xxD motif
MSELATEDQLPSKILHHRPRYRALLSISGLVLTGTIAAACGSSTAAPPAGTGTGTSATTPAAVDTTTDAKFGTILVNGKGFTLYRLSTDSTNKSACNSACAKVWPPLLMTGSGSAVAGSGVTGLGTIKVSEGEQVTYKGMPLYTFIGDTSAGQVNGQGVKDTWGTWFAIVTKASTTTAPAGVTTTTTGGGGGGVGF